MNLKTAVTSLKDYAEYLDNVQGNFCDSEPRNQQGKCNPAVPDGLALSLCSLLK